MENTKGVKRHTTYDLYMVAIDKENKHILRKLFSFEIIESLHQTNETDIIIINPFFKVLEEYGNETLHFDPLGHRDLYITH